jgi:hypothetical protein
MDPEHLQLFRLLSKQQLLVLTQKTSYSPLLFCTHKRALIPQPKDHVLAISSTRKGEVFEISFVPLIASQYNKAHS